jgi:hypothetical protein
MPIRQPRYPKEEFARRGSEIYERDIRHQVEADHQGKFVAIDIETGTWVMDADDYVATELLIQKIPDAQIWLSCVGQLATYRIGGPRRVVHAA